MCPLPPGGHASSLVVVVRHQYPRDGVNGGQKDQPQQGRGQVCQHCVDVLDVIQRIARRGAVVDDAPLLNKGRDWGESFEKKKAAGINCKRGEDKD